MTHLQYTTSDRDRKCRLCNKMIERNTKAIVLIDVHVSPKIVDLHFHETCLINSIDMAKINDTIKT